MWTRSSTSPRDSDAATATRSGVLARTEVRGALPFARAITAVKEHDIKAWLIEWDRALKTKANYHGLRRLRL
jgi:hypothetical protein